MYRSLVMTAMELARLRTEETRTLKNEGCGTQRKAAWKYYKMLRCKARTQAEWLCYEKPQVSAARIAAAT